MRQVLLPLLWLAAFAAATPASAQAPERTEARSQREDAGARVRQVERAGGRVLQAEPMQRGGQEVYRLKVLTPEGRVRVISDDGRGREAEDLTARRRDFRNDQGTDVAREREERQQREARDARRRGAPARGGPARSDGDDRNVD